MTTESLEEIRQRLLQEERVQRMIQMRAYEIYQMRGCQPGGEAHDWFHAEGEVLAFLIASESTRAAEQITGDQIIGRSEPEVSNAPVKKRIAKPRRSAEATQTTRQSTAPKRAATKKSTKPKTKPVRSGNSSKQESTN